MLSVVTDFSSRPKKLVLPDMLKIQNPEFLITIVWERVEQSKTSERRALLHYFFNTIYLTV